MTKYNDHSNLAHELELPYDNNADRDAAAEREGRKTEHALFLQ